MKEIRLAVLAEYHGDNDAERRGWRQSVVQGHEGLQIFDGLKSRPAR